jgi:hypothetical protein
MVTVGRWAYDLMYRVGAPWEGADRVEVVEAPTRTRHVGTWLLERRETGDA